MMFHNGWRGVTSFRRKTFGRQAFDRRNQGDQNIGGKFAQFLDRVAKTVAKPKKNCHNIFFKAKFESKDLHQTFLNS